jgi:hypothetical protein
MRAQVAINSDGSVDFGTNCEDSMYEATTGAVWTLIPDGGTTCVDTPADRLDRLNRDQQTLCSGGSWKPQEGIKEGLKPGFTGFKEITEWSTIQGCGLFNWGWLWYRGWVS